MFSFDFTPNFLISLYNILQKDRLSTDEIINYMNPYLLNSNGSNYLSLYIINIRTILYKIRTYKDEQIIHLSNDGYYYINKEHVLYHVHKINNEKLKLELKSELEKELNDYTTLNSVILESFNLSTYNDKNYSNISQKKTNNKNKKDYEKYEEYDEKYEEDNEEDNEEETNQTKYYIVKSL
jgi:hypothetical protein